VNEVRYVAKKIFPLRNRIFSAETVKESAFSN